jgi:hypothetical protein
MELPNWYQNTGQMEQHTRARRIFPLHLGHFTGDIPGSRNP